MITSVGRLFLGGVLGLLLACGGGDDGGYGELCTEKACPRDLTCPTRGTLAGVCTRSCTNDDECMDKLGPAFVCVPDRICVKTCMADGECPGVLGCDPVSKTCR